MNRVLFFSIFLLVVSSIYFGMHYIIYKFLVKNLILSARLRFIIKLVFIFSGSSFLISMIFKRMLNLRFYNYYANIWLGFISIAFFIILISWLLMKVTGYHSSGLTISILVVIGLISIYSLINGFRQPRIKKIEIPIKNLPKELNGFTLVQISDLHMESYKSKRTIGNLIERINNLNSDLVVITGDLVDENVCLDEEFCYQLKRIHARYGTIAITGNHEFFAGIKNIEKTVATTGIKMLRNQKTVIADHLQIVGLEDDTARQFSLSGPQLESTLKQCDPQKPIILLYHRPLKFDQAVKLGVDLQLSGHTHAGQIPPMDLIVMLVYKYPVGLYEKDGAYIYTTSGTGYWGPPMRLFSRSEIVHITLISKNP